MAEREKTRKGQGIHKASVKRDEAEPTSLGVSEIGRRIMRQKTNDRLHRRYDGSIDVEFYARRAARLRREALRESPRRWVMTCRAALGLS